MSALYDHSLLGIRDMLASRAVSAREAVASCLARITETDPHLRAMIPPLMDAQALAEADAMDKAGPDPAKPLWGVPLAAKDCICVAGHRTTCASKILEDFVPFYDADVITRLRAAGAIIVGKTNLDEFAMGSSTEFSAFQSTANPWDLSRTPGGSSGGSAAAVAAKQVFGALGSDTGGSIRQPASFCGCVGVKPTYGRVSRYGVSAYASSMDQVGVLTRTVEDAALFLQVISGHDPKDSTSAPIAVPDYLAAVRKAAASNSLAGIRIGVPREFWDANSPEVESACRAALDKAQKLGAELVDVSLPHTRYGVVAYYILSPAEASTNLARYDGIRYGLRDKGADELVDLYVRSRSTGFGDEVKRRILLGTFVLSAGYYDAYYRKAAQVRRLILEDYTKALTDCHILAAPTSPVTAWNLGEAADPLTTYHRDALTLSLNLAGFPGLSIPVGLGAESKLPVGMQLFAPAFAEERLLECAQALAAPDLGAPRGITAA